MRRISQTLSVLLSLSIFSCNCTKHGDNTKATAAATSTTAATTTATSAATETMPGIEGTYSGSLPCTDCAGILTTVYLFEGNKYRMESRYLGKPGEPEVKAGNFTYDQKKNVISFDGGKDHFLVADGKLTKLDANGSTITGDQAERYNLLKQDPVAERLWRLSELYSKPVNPVQDETRTPAISFDKSQMRVSGSGGCNSFSGDYSMPGGNKLSFSAIAATKMACDLMDIEGQFFKALSETVSFKVKDGKLSFQNAEGNEIARFENFMQK